MFRARRGGSSAAPAAETEGGRGRGEDGSDEAGGGRGSAGSVPTLPGRDAEPSRAKPRAEPRRTWRGDAAADDADDTDDTDDVDATWTRPHPSTPTPPHPHTTLLPTTSVQYKHADTSIITIFSVLY